MACKPCEERWRITLAQQLKTTNMKDLKEKKASNIEVVSEEIVSSQNNKLDVNKLIEERRAKILSNQVINK